MELSATWVFGTGQAVTLPTAQYNGVNPDYFNFYNYSYPFQYYESRNSFRMRPYHRLDFGMNLHKQKKHFERIWSFAVYNGYNRQNPFFLFFDYDYYGNKQLKQLSLFPIIPSIAWRAKF
jgi:hypothetical protein